MLLHPDRLFPSDPTVRQLARKFYAGIQSLPIISPHGHTQAAWFAAKTSLFPTPQLSSSCPTITSIACCTAKASLEDLEIGQPAAKDPRKVWRIFASHYTCFAERPTRMWLDLCLSGTVRPGRASLGEERRPLLRHHLRQAQDSGVPAARLFERFNIEVLSTTDSPLDLLGGSQGDSRLRMEGTHYAHLPPRLLSSIRSLPDLQA